MKTAVIALIFSAGFAFGADPQTKVEPQSGELRRLDSVTWDLKTHTLSWVVVKGTEENGEFVPSGSQRYQVTPDDAKMGAGVDSRAIRDDEAAVLHKLLDTLSVYCARSVVWWENADDDSTTPATPPSGGTPTFKPERPATKQPAEDEAPPKARPDPPKPVKVGVVAAAHMVAK